MKKHMEHALHFTAVVLAGGRSSRMGSDKAFLQIGGETLLARQLRLVREAGSQDLLISGCRGADYSSFDARVVYDQESDAGPLAGIVAALTAASFPLVLVLAVDMPAMTLSMLNRILSQCGENMGCVPADEIASQPLAAVYPKSALRLALRRLANHEYTAREFASEAASEGLIKPLKLRPAEISYFTNWNAPSDWKEGS